MIAGLVKKLLFCSEKASTNFKYYLFKIIMSTLHSFVFTLRL